MDLKKNYERFFGKITEQKTEKPKPLSKEQLTKFSNITKNLALKFPNAPLRLFEGYVYAGSIKLESAESFLKKSNVQIQEQIRVISNSKKRGLYD